MSSFGSSKVRTGELVTISSQTVLVALGQIDSGHGCADILLLPICVALGMPRLPTY